MKKIIILIVIISGIVMPQDTTAIDTTWQKELLASLSYSQAYFDNWATGGENALVGQFDLNGELINNSEIFVWTNKGKLAYGNSKLGDAEVQKTLDEIRFESNLTYLTNFVADPYLALKGETQLAPGYEYTDDIKIQVSAFLDPGYFTQSLGLQYSMAEEASIRLGAAVKETITKDYSSHITDVPDTEELEKIKIEPGVESVITFSKKLNEATLINSTLDAFNNFSGINTTDIRWDTDITTKITKYISVKFNLRLFYDEDISAKRQLNQALLLGVSYAIF